MKKFIVFISAGIAAMTFTRSAEAFSDVEMYNDEISFLEQQEIFTGYGDGEFKPAADLTRLQAVQVLVREMGVSDESAADPGFIDITEDSYGYAEIAAAAELGIISGKTNEAGEKYFDRYAPLTRSQMAKIMSEGYDLLDDQRISFIDVPMLHWANDYVNSLAANDITTGFSDSTFRPQENIQRQHFAVFMARLLNDEFKPSFNQDSFMPDQSKIYTYQTGDSTLEIKHIEGDTWERRFGVNNEISRESKIIESNNGIVFGEPQLVFSFALGYPIKEGHKWIDQNALTLEITDVNATITTPAGTFNHAIEVKADGYIDYYVEGIGLVKSTWYGSDIQRVVAELIEIN
ncbi:S-layer homology domain-containing protein [Jeotgalibacillus salarius]|uniref:S-layer homology domain-containing protein n=1 Tax=Jeotgalibacillus salarius TaxID=546023 RepID=A0A4Y8LM34_9BACL|nr:S-layer homology domain-containing protein [Jeotgalibacillus salarius]TFE04006.1 S-layer homology domain-containing protein [Jeotgalibacillus salarius]